MINDVKINLSPEEAELVNDPEWIFAKHRIISKVYTLLGNASLAFQEAACSSPALSSEILKHAPKIARGEQYHQLPYVMLDYPRFFGKQDTLALRTFFWWGHSFSVHLLVAGCWMSPVRKALHERGDWLAAQGFHLCTNTTPWDHRFEVENYLPLVQWIANGKHPVEDGQGFIKIGRYLPLQQWEEASRFIRESGEMLLSLVGVNQAPSR